MKQNSALHVLSLSLVAVVLVLFFQNCSLKKGGDDFFGSDTNPSTDNVPSNTFTVSVMGFNSLGHMEPLSPPYGSVQNPIPLDYQIAIKVHSGIKVLGASNQYSVVACVYAGTSGTNECTLSVPRGVVRDKEGGWHNLDYSVQQAQSRTDGMGWFLEPPHPSYASYTNPNMVGEVVPSFPQGIPCNFPKDFKLYLKPNNGALSSVTDITMKFKNPTGVNCVQLP